MFGVGGDVVVEEEGRGGVWCGDVFLRWWRESEEIAYFFGLL